jgi:hypothetical protein
MRNLWLLLLCSMLASCSTTPTPVSYNCPVIILPPDPIPEVNKLTIKSKPNEIIKAWVATAVQYHDWNVAVHRQIEASA